MNRTIVVLLLTCACLSGHLRAQTRESLLVGKTTQATVTSVVDGDTVHVRLRSGQSITVRLDGIDTPEMGEPFSTRARNAARVMLFDRDVQVKGTDVDRYGRLVARVVVDGVDSSQALVSQGLACHYVRYSSDRALAAAQGEAQRAGRGFWAAGAGQPACVVQNSRAPKAGTALGPFHGNVRSHVFHAATCPNYACRNCTVVFPTRADAERAGFRPAGDCIDR